MSKSRYIIGIDLGTTNSSIAYVDTESGSPESLTLPITQIIAPGEVANENCLPSFLYLPELTTISPGSLNLPWSTGNEDFAVGFYARKLGASLPGKIVASAKSWLCADNVDRLSPILPIEAEDERKISPVEASAKYLKHLAAVWDNQFAKNDKSLAIRHQEVVLTVPASFDAVARELTVKAAEEAGLQVTLLEEPQAAFYNWLHEHEENWRNLVEAGSNILVCDIGGGTSDFSLIGVENENGDLSLKRLAVGNHILLGGDNMDFTLAYAIQQKLKQRLNAKQLAALIHQCRQAKEKLLSDNSIEKEKITILGSGSSLIGGTLNSELTRDEVNTLLLNGFTPECPFGEKTNKALNSGLRSFGLKYETDTALTKHLSEFLTIHAPETSDGKKQLPSAILFNGGVTKATLLRKRVVDLMNSWKGEEVTVLTGIDPDLAVARGAAWYGFVKRGNAIRIKSGSPLSYYIGIESSMPAVPGFPPPLEALCVLPFGTENGTSLNVPMKKLGLVTGETCQFRLFSSNNRPEDKLGERIDEFSLDQLTELPPLTTVMTDNTANNNGNIVAVKIASEFTEIGTIKIWFNEVGSERRWQLEFELGEVKK